MRTHMSILDLRVADETLEDVVQLLLLFGLLQLRAPVVNVVNR